MVRAYDHEPASPMSPMPADKCHIPPAFWREMNRAGLPPEVLLRDAQLPATLHLNATACVTTAQYFTLWKAIEQRLPEPGLGIRLVETLDTAEAQEKIIKTFSLKNAEAEEVAKQLQDLNQDTSSQSRYPFYIFSCSKIFSVKGNLGKVSCIVIRKMTVAGVIDIIGSSLCDFGDFAIAIFIRFEVIGELAARG